MFKSMNCMRVEKFLPLHVAGDLTGGRRRRAVERHLAACERCRRAAAEHQASLEMFRAATLPPDFDGAFYEEIRNSVLARIRRDHTLAPPRALFRLANARLAYAASLALLVLAATLALHSYTRRAHEVGERQKMIAAVKPEQAATPAAIKTRPSSRPADDGRSSPRAFRESARGASDARRRSLGLSPPHTSANGEHARREAQQSRDAAHRAPSLARRNPLAPPPPDAATERAGATEIAGAGDVKNAQQSEVSRIEIQTSDPNIRIIWLSPATEESARPLQ